MIKTEFTYKEAIEKLDKAFIETETNRFKDLGLDDASIKLAIQPYR